MTDINAKRRPTWLLHITSTFPPSTTPPKKSWRMNMKHLTGEEKTTSTTVCILACLCRLLCDDDMSLLLRGGLRHSPDANDRDDVVSIGGEEDDLQELAAFHSRTQQGDGEDGTPHPNVQPPSVEATKNSPQRDPKDAPATPGSPPADTPLHDSQNERKLPPEQSESQSSSGSVRAPLMHALPPKPSVGAPGPVSRSSSFVGASSMSDSRRNQEGDSGRRVAVNGSRQAISSEALPPDWETRHSSGGELYYYNTRTLVSQWDRPTLNGKAPQMTTGDSYTGDNLAKTRDSGDSRSDRFRETREFKQADRSRPPSPGRELSREDRHYRPADTPDVSSYRYRLRDRRGQSPSPDRSQNAIRDDMPKDIPKDGLYSQARADRDTARYDQRPGINEARMRRKPSPDVPERPSISRNDSRDEQADRMRGSTSDRGYGRGARRDVVPAQDFRSGQQRFADDPTRGPSLPSGQFKEPLSHPRDDALSSTQRSTFQHRIFPLHGLRKHMLWFSLLSVVLDMLFMSALALQFFLIFLRHPFAPSGSHSFVCPSTGNRSRSPPPHLQASTSFRGGNDANRNYGEPFTEHQSNARLPGNRPSRTDFQPDDYVHRSQWESSSGHRDAGLAIDVDLPIRRPREQDSRLRNDMGIDVKRRRLDDHSTDSALARRRRSPSPVETRDAAISSGAYATGRDTRSDRRANINDGKRPSGALSHEMSRDDGWASRRMRQGELPNEMLGPNPGNKTANTFIRPADAYRPDTERFERDNGWQRAPTVSSRDQDAGRQLRRDSRGFEASRRAADQIAESNSRSLTLEPMDIDGPRVRVGPPPGAGSMYTGRSLHSRESREISDFSVKDARNVKTKGLPPSPIGFGPSRDMQVHDVRNLETPGIDGRGSPCSQEHRGTRFGAEEDTRRAIPGHVDENVREPRVAASDPSKKTIASDNRQANISAQPKAPLLPNDWMPSERIDIPNAPRYIRLNREKAMAAKRARANPVPVPPPMTTTTGSTVADSASVGSQRDTKTDSHRPEGTQPIQDSRVAASPGVRYTSLHGDVERQMSLNDRTENMSRNRISERDTARGLDEPGYQPQVKQRPIENGDFHRSGSRASRFSKPHDDGSLVSEPRVWITREDAAAKSEARTRSPPSPSGVSMGLVTNLSGDARAHRSRDSLMKDATDPSASPSSISTYNRHIPPPDSSTRRQVPELHSPIQYPDDSHGDKAGGRDSPSEDRRIGHTLPSHLPNIVNAPAPPEVARRANEGDRYNKGPRNLRGPNSPLLQSSNSRQRVETSRLEATQTESGYKDGRYDRPGQLRSNSLLQRLSMTDGSSPPGDKLPLRDRFDLSEPASVAKSGYEEPLASSEHKAELDTGHSNSEDRNRGRNQLRGRGRGRNRRRGRGGYVDA
ncbi:uncharacterized protein FOMMEDRAFT_168263 [Fomitiporia mediterranea MF3/22]|uniref:uncharacterized protein n=1 Tax=Fomitiporia mediterranea (strain MF3/22) TaxID=694068 RepID=UPI00044091B3|nr:uncharacterized protein FOMMEDRAFT_168263 [Fomitiporia mediterranea MF3/22]EJD03247.1 hypothetical protein FOMMEDRAFT_168263 [Fomitiporia mediterranea MF3/22]